MCSLFSGVGRGTEVTVEGKQEEEPGLQILLPWKTSHLIPLPSHGISSPGLPSVQLHLTSTLIKGDFGQVTKVMDTLELTEKENELGPPYS